MPETEELLRSNSRASQYLEDWTSESSCPGPEPAPEPAAQPATEPRSRAETKKKKALVAADAARVELLKKDLECQAQRTGEKTSALHLAITKHESPRLVELICDEAHEEGRDVVDIVNFQSQVLGLGAPHSLPTGHTRTRGEPIPRQAHVIAQACLCFRCRVSPGPEYGGGGTGKDGRERRGGEGPL